MVKHIHLLVAQSDSYVCVQQQRFNDVGLKLPLSVIGPLVYTPHVAVVFRYKPSYNSMYICMTIVKKHGRNYGG